MNSEPTRPFDSIESAHEFIALLEESIGDAVRDVKDHAQQASQQQDARSVEALNLALYKMSQLSSHMHKSRRILNDLRTIRRLLFQER
jgi:predicted nuclease of restriction endonuclease-like RecB superfamily